MDISIDVASGLPIYRQITNQIRYMVASGILQPGDEIPSIRATALRLKVTPNTVVRAYNELEATGVLEKRHGAGTFVAETRISIANRERERIIEQRIDALLTEAHQLGYEPDELLEVFRRRQAAFEGVNQPEETDERMRG